MAGKSLLSLVLLISSAFLVSARSNLRSVKFTLRDVEGKGQTAGLIPGLLGGLQARQACSTPGYSPCPTGVACCPTGGDCCTGAGACCPAGYSCYAQGCCRTGYTCTGPASGCADPSEVVCPNDTFCCPPGVTCYRTVNGLAQCGGLAPSPSPSPPPPPPPPPPSTTIRPTTVASPSSTLGPNAPRNQSISANDAQIMYTGNWQSTSSICDSQSQAKKCQGGGNSFTYRFKGTAIYIKIGAGPDGGLYSATIDGSGGQGDSFVTTGRECDIGFKKENLPNANHNVVVKSLGVSAQAPVGNPGNLDFEGLIITQEDDINSTPTPIPGSSAQSLRPATNLRTLIQVVGLLIWFVI